MSSTDTTDMSGKMAAKGKTLLKALKESYIIILVVIAMITLVIIVVFIFNIIQKNKLKNVVLHKNTITLNNRDIVPYKVESKDLTGITINGQEFSYSFWLFLSNTYDITSGPKMILTRGNDATTPNIVTAATSPIIAMDAVTNKMQIALSTTAVTTDTMLSGDSNTVFQRDANTGKYTSGFLCTYIDYIPLQRWVNIIVVAKDTSMYVYFDGDIYTVSSVNDISSVIRPTIRGTNGTVYIGDKKNTTPGYISQTQFYNYALTQKEVRYIYRSGPIKSSWLSALGMGNYGVRSPIYEL